MTQITGKIYQQTNAAGTENRFPRTVMEAVLGLNSHLQQQFGALADIYMPIEGISESKPNQEFVFRKTPNTIKAKALTLDKIKGKTLAWNQLVPNTASSTTADGITYTNNGDGSWSVSGTATSISSALLKENFQNDLVVGHKYILHIYGQQKVFIRDIWSGFFNTNTPTIYTHQSNVECYLALGVNNETVISSAIKVYPYITDLTLLYGSDIDGMTDAQILAKYESEYAGYHAYNPGDLISNDAESLETVGFNQWDEEWESGYIGYEPHNAGQPQPNASTIRTKNFIPVIPGNSYYFLYPGAETHYYWLYDANFNCIANAQYINGSGEITIPGNAAFMKFACEPAYGTTYNHDICINLSDPARNGQYEPYKKSVGQLNLKTRTGKLNGQGASVIVFPDGMNGVGTSFDEANRTKGTKRRARVNLGDLNYQMDTSRPINTFYATINGVKDNGQGWNDSLACSKYAVKNGADVDKSISYFVYGKAIFIADSAYTDAASFKAAMDGVYLDYELATPQEYVWDEPMPMSTNAGITESRISPNADGISAPMCCDITYGMGASDYATDAEYASYAGNAKYAEVAARLLNARTIWGQVFDGSANITGAMTGVSAIDSLMYFDTSNGRIGIGISTPLYNLDVAGTFHAAGNTLIGGTLSVDGKFYAGEAEIESIIPSNTEFDSEHSINIPLWRLEEDGEAEFGNTYIRGLLKLRAFYYDDGTFHDATMQYEYDDKDASNCFISADKSIHAPSFVQSSDIRLKTDLHPIALTVEQIASAPAVEFNWVGNGQRGAGSIAQYWEGLLPYNVHHNGDLLTMEYGNIALISAIVCARKIQELEEQVNELKEIINNK